MATETGLDPAAAPPAPAAGGKPYVGLRPFKEEHRAIFFGRRRETDDLTSLVLAHTEVLLYSQSGAGKTSLIQAGLIPLLRDVKKCEVLLARVQGPLGNVEMSKLTNVYVFHALQGWAGPDTEPTALAGMSLLEYLSKLALPEEEDELPLPRVIIFDQFEELFTAYPQYWKQRRGFFEQVRDALQGDRRRMMGNLHVLFAMREDHVASVDPYAALLPEKLRTRYRLERLRKEAATLAITGPLRHTNRHFAPGVPEAIVQDLLEVEIDTPQGKQKVEDEYIEPVQLQVVCQSLWQDLPPTAVEITQEHLKKSANVTWALADFYQQSVWAVVRAGKADEEALRRWFEEKLITPAGTRGMVAAGEVEVAGLPLPAVAALENSYLIRRESRGRGSSYELTHDRLIVPIRLANRVWFERNALWIHFRRLMRSKWCPVVLTVGVALLVILGLEWRKGQQAQREAIRQKIELNVNRGLRLLEVNDHSGALLWFTESLDLAAKHYPARQEVQRRRLGAVFEQMAKVAYLWNPGKDKGSVDYAKFSPDGLLVAAAVNHLDTKSGEVRLLDPKAADPAPWISLEATRLYSVEFHPNQRDKPYLVTASGSWSEDRGEARIWHAATGQLVWEWRTEKPVTYAAFSPDKQFLVTVSEGARDKKWLVSLFDAEQITAGHDARGHAWEVGGSVNRVTFSPDGRLLVTAGGDTTVEAGAVHVFDVSTKGQVWAQPFDEPVNHAEFSPDGRFLVTAGNDTRAVLWDWNTKARVQTLKHGSWVYSAAFSPDGRHLVTASRDTAARVWDVATGELALPALNLNKTVNYAEFSADGRRVLMVGIMTLGIWDLGQANAAATSPRNLRAEGWAKRTAFGLDGHYLVSAGRADGEGVQAQLWDTHTGEPVGEALTLRGPITVTAVSKDGSLVATVSELQAAKEELLPVVGASTFGWLGAALGPGPFLAASALIPGGAKEEVLVWNPKTTQQRPWSGLNGRVKAAAFGETDKDQGRPLLALITEDATGKLGEVSAWEAHTGEERWRKSLPGAVKVAFSPDGKRLAVITKTSSGAGEVHVYETGNGQKVVPEPLGHDEPIFTALFSPDGQRLVTASEDNSARVWDLEKRTKKDLSKHHTADVLYAAFSADGKLVVTASFDGTAAVWDTENGKLRATLKHDNVVNHATFREDGLYVVTASQDATARLWDLGPLLSGPGAETEPAGLMAILRHQGPVHSASFSHKGDRIVTVNSRTLEPAGGKVGNAWPALHQEARQPEKARAPRQCIQTRTWSISADLRDVDSLRRHGRMLSGRKVEEGQERLVPLQPEENQQAQGFVSTVDPPVRAEVLAWHRRQADNCEVAGQWFAAAWHLGKLIHQVKDDFSLYDRRGTAYAALTDWDKVVSDATSALRLRGKDWRSWHRRAQAYAQLSQWELAGGDLIQATELGMAVDWRLLRERARIYAKLSRSVDAIADYTAALALETKTPILWVERARLYRNQGRWADAISDYDRAIALTDNDEQIDLLKARVQLRELLPNPPTDEIIADYKAILDRRKDDWDSYQKRAAMYARKKDVGAAVQDYLAAARGYAEKAAAGPADVVQLRSQALTLLTRAVSLDEKNVGVLEPRAKLFAELARWPQAEADYATVVKAKPDDVQLRAEYARACAAVRKWDEAIENYEQAIRHEAKASLLLQCSGAYAERAFERAGRADWKKAAKYLYGAIQQDKLSQYNHRLWMRLALIHLASDEMGEYQKICQHLVRQFEKDEPFTANNLAWTCTLGPSPGVPAEHVVQLAERAVAGDPTAARLHTLGAALVRAKRYPEAADVLGKSRVASKSARDDGTVLDQLFMAMTLHGMGQPDRAKVWLDRAVVNITRAPQRYPGDTFRDPSPWQNQLELQLLRRELEALLAGP